MFFILSNLDHCEINAQKMSILCLIQCLLTMGITSHLWMFMVPKHLRYDSGTSISFSSTYLRLEVSSIKCGSERTIHGQVFAESLITCMQIVYIFLADSTNHFRIVQVLFLGLKVQGKRCPILHQYNMPKILTLWFSVNLVTNGV